jgi:hypothetical protein
VPEIPALFFIYPAHLLMHNAMVILKRGGAKANSGSILI